MVLSQNYHKLNNKIASFVVFIPIIFLAYIMSEIFWDVLSEDETNQNILNVASNNSNNKNISLPTELFGKYVSPIVQKQKEIKKTNLNLELIGILNKSDKSLAIIKQNNNAAKIYKVGDSLNPSTKIKSIHDRYVIIDSSGEDEKISMLRNKIEETSVKPSVKKDPVKIQAASKKKLKQYLGEIVQNPRNLLSIIKVAPNFSNGALDGFTVSPGNDRKLFNEIGLRNGDVIININGIIMNDFSNVAKLTNKISGINEFSIVIKRKGQIKNLFVNLN